jgi:hypothetical protein
MTGCVSFGSVSCPAPPIVFIILGAEPALNNLSKFRGPPQSPRFAELFYCKIDSSPFRLLQDIGQEVLAEPESVGVGVGIGVGVGVGAGAGGD